MSVTARQAWVGFVLLLLFVLLVLAAVYWHHVTSVNFLQVLADVPDFVGHGC